MRKFIQLILLVAFGTLQAQNDTVTFKVDMNDYTGSFTTVNVNGNFNGWCGGCNPMTDANSDGVWEVALPLTAGTIEYKFTLDGWTAQENFSPGGTCTVTAGGFTNRVLTFSGNNTVLPVVCYNSCLACTGVVLSQVDLPISWDDALVNYTTVSFGGNVDIVATDPTDATNSVLQLDKGLGTQTWAGTTLSAGGLATAIPFTVGGANTISVRFWSPDAGAAVLLKVEDKTNGGIFVETTDTTTVAGGWEILTFNFNNPGPNAATINTANTYDLVSIFPNFGVDGNTAGAKTYYVDDVVYGTITTGMAGVYTIDPAGSGSMNYTSFSAAAADLVSLGVVGACTFNVAPGSYTDTVYLPAIMGTSSTNTIMFDGGDSATTSLAYNTAAINQKAVILLDGADYVTFKGLTITHPGTTDSWGIRMQNDNDNLTVDGCRFEMAVTTSTGSDIAAIASTGSSTSSFTETEGGDNTTIINSAFINGQYGVHFEALAAFSDSNLVINNNLFEGNYYRYFMSDNTYNMTMNGNTMRGMPATSTSGYAVALYDIIGFEINNNNIICSDWGIYISDGNFDGAPPATSNITNNMITSSGDEAFYVDDFESANVYYNTFVTTSTSTSAYGAYFNDCINVDVRNNVFYGEATYAVWFSDNTTLTSTTSAPITLDHNIYYTVGGSSLAYDAGAQADLAAWQLARANNVNSLSGDPIFLDPTSDLHMAGGLANNAATPIASVTMDIDGDMRSATTPDLGADEYLPASCLPVSGVATIMAYADSVSIGWIGNNGATATFNIEYGPLGFTPGAGTTVTAHPDSSITITGLMANTDYEIYITANCGAGGLGATVGPTAFRTALAGPRVITCATGTLGSLLTEEFDNATSFTGDIGGGNGFWMYDNNTTSSSNTGPSAPQSGTHYIYYESSSGDSAAMVSPAIDLTAASQNVELSFWMHAYGATIGVLKVGVSTSATGPFTNVFTYGPGQLQTDELDPWQNVGVNLDAYLGQTIYIQFNYIKGASFDSDLAIDLFEVKSCLSCLTPSALTAANITSTTADITWTSGASNLGSTIEYGPNGFTPGTGTILTSTTGTVSLTGLSPVTQYQVYVTDSCGAGDVSSLSGPISFTTVCGAIIPPSLEDFSNGWTPNACWDEGDGGTPATGPAALGLGGWGTDGFANNGTTGAVKINLYNTGDEDWMLSPQYDLGTGANLQVEFDFGVFAWNTTNPASLGSDDEVQLLISTDNGATWVNLATYNNTYVTNASGNHEVATLYTYTGVVQFAIWATEGVIDDPEDNDIFVDNFEVRVTPACPDPAAVLATNITSTDADITWTSSVGGVGSSLEYGPAGFTPGTGTLITSTTDSVHLSGLMSATAYDVYVTDSCGASGVSATIGPITFTTLCPASFLAPYSTDFENITIGQQTSYENCWSLPATTTPRWEAEDATGGNENSTATGPFYDNTNFGSAGGTYMYLETSSGATGGKGLLSSPTIDFASLTAPQLDFYYHMYGATMGVLRIYAEDASGTLTILDSIVGQQQTAGSDAWIKKSIDLSSLAGTSYSFVFEGERGTSFTGDISIDDFSVAEAPNCFASTALTVISTSDNSAELTWTAGSGTSWDIEYGPAGFTPGSGTMFNATNDTITISGLMASTAYEFYVTDSCGASGVASTAGPASFTTSACPLADQCAYTVDLYDSFGDGWNGGEITIFQNGVAVASFGSTFSTGFNSLGNPVNLCDNVPTTVTLSTAGAWPSEIGVVVINPNGDTAGVHLASPTVGTGDTLFAFTSNCSACPAIAAPYFESFEANSATVGCWSNVFVADTFSWTLGTGSTGGAITGAYAGSQNAVFVSTNGGPDTTLFVSPVIDMTALISPQLSFWYAQEEWFGDQNVTNVYYRASASDPWTFLFGDNANRNTWTQALVSLPNPSSTYQIAIEGVNNWGHANVIDSLSITDAAQICTAPDSVAASNITTTNADITWVSGSNQSSSWIEYGPLGFTPGTGMILNPATTPATLSGLMPGTIYEACVYDICSVLGDTSAAACVTFTTLCAPITMYPYSENFDMGIIPACYASTGTTTGPFLWAPDAGGTPSGATGPAVDNTTGTGAGFYMYTEASSPAAAGDSAFLELPEFNLTSLTVPEISYFYHMFGADIQSLELEVYDATTMTWSSINSIVGQQQTANGDAWMEARVDLSAYVTSTNLRMRFLTVRGASFNGDVALDDITVRETPACVDPSNLMVTNATSSSISLSWMSDTNIVSSTIEYGPIGFSLGTGTQVTATPSAFTVTGLASGACFEFYVRDSCSSATAWIGPVNSCTIATCSVSSIPVSATSDTTDCDGGSVSLSAVSSTGNDLVWLNNGQAVSTGANFVSDSISFTTAFDVAEFVTTTPVLHVGPLTNIAAAGFGNFSNGQWITVNDTIHIDSMVVRHNNDVVAQVVLWTDDSFSNLVQLGDTFSTPAATVGDLQVPVNMVVTPGVYFMNLNFISGAGQLFRATGGAAYPYSLAGLMSIDSTNFADQSRIYYTFDMTVSKACIGTPIQGFGIVPGANAGLTDTVSVCSTESMVDLTSFLGVYDFGGTWTDLSATGALTDSIFDATAVTAGASYDFSYILAGVNGCAGDTAFLNVTVEAAPDAGADSSFALCIGSGNVILRTYITGNPFGGTWVDLDNSGALNTTGVWRSNVATAGTFRVAYILSGTVCAADTAILTISSDNAVSAGIAVSDTVCDQNAMVDLNTFLDASATTGGTWSDLSSTGALSANMFDATAVTNNSSYDFQYKVMSACGDDSIVVTLYVDDCDVSVRELSTGFINIYPNPTSGLIKIENKAVKGEVRVELYSANGQLMMSKNFGENEGMSLDITDYATGIYTVKVNSEKGLDVKRIIKQ